MWSMAVYLRYLGPSHFFEDEQSGTKWARYGEAQSVSAEDRDRVCAIPNEHWEQVEKEDADALEDPAASHVANLPAPASAESTLGTADAVHVVAPDSAEATAAVQPGEVVAADDTAEAEAAEAAEES